MYESKEYDHIFRFLVKLFDQGVQDQELVPERVKV